MSQFDLTNQSSGTQYDAEWSKLLSQKEERPTPKVTANELADEWFTDLLDKTSINGKVFGMRATKDLQGEISQWEIVKEYYGVPDEDKKCLKTEWVKLSEVRKLILDSYDPNKNEINCKDWNGIPVSAFTTEQLEINLEKTISNYKIVGVPITFGIMSGCLFFYTFLLSNKALRNKFDKETLSQVSNAFVASELGLYEGGPLGGMNPKYVDFFSKAFIYCYRGKFEHEEFDSIYEMWVDAFCDGWQPELKSERVFNIIWNIFELIQMAKLMERNQFNERKCPKLLGKTWDNMDAFDCEQLAILLLIHRRAAQGRGSGEESRAGDLNSLIYRLDIRWLDENISENNLIGHATRDLLGAIEQIKMLKDQANSNEWEF